MKSLRELLAKIDGRLFMSGFIVLLLAAVSLAWNESPRQPIAVDSSWREPVLRRSVLFAAQLPSPEPEADATPTQTALPAELLANYQQTTGVIIFAGVVVLVVVAGVFNELIKERKTRT